MQLFGIEFKRKKDIIQQEVPSISSPSSDDGALVIAANGYHGQYVDVESQGAKSDSELITRYRNMSQQPEIDSAIDDIINEAIVVEDETPIVELVLDDVKELSDPIKEVIIEEFDNIQKLLEFEKYAYDIFRKFYIDGRLNYEVVVDTQNLQDGIQELKYIDPRKIRKVREVVQANNSKIGQIVSSNDLTQIKDEYFIYNEKGFDYSGNVASAAAAGSSPTTGVRIAKDSIIYVTSGLNDPSGKTVYSHLHKAIRPLNLLRSLEDAGIIYRLARAPEKRVFYVDTGTLPKMKAEQHLKDMMTRYKNKLVYDPQTGEIKDSRKFMTMLEDFWLTRREGGKGTEIDVLQPGQMQGILEEIDFFQMKLYKSLNIPYSRFNPDMAFSFGRATEISRDEVKFSTFIDRMRIRFNDLFLQCLEKQLVLKNIITPDEWNDIKYHFKFKYARNNLFAELKNAEIQLEKLNRLQIASQFAGQYYSHEWVQKNVLGFTEEQIQEEQMKIIEEMQNPLLHPEFFLQAGQDQQDQESQTDNNMDTTPPKNASNKQKPITKSKRAKNAKKT